MLMNLKRFVRWPTPLNVAVHLQRTDESFRSSSAKVLVSDAESRCAAEIPSLPQRIAFLVSPTCPLEAVPILRQANGKPGMLGQGIQFNVSHCEDWCALAWSAESAVGVAVDVIRPIRNIEEIVNNFFPPIAQGAFDAASAQNKTTTFFHWWTRIEAALKASGKGLDDSYECLDDVIHEVCDVVPGVALAVAVVGSGPLTVTWHLP